jgi:hypothetical protein
MRKQGDDAAASRPRRAEHDATRVIPRLAPWGLYEEAIPRLAPWGFDASVSLRGVHGDHDLKPVAALDSREEPIQVGEVGSRIDGVHADRQRLRERRDVERYRVRHRVQQPGVRAADQQQWGEAALGSAAADPAELLVAGLHHHPVPGRHRGDVFAHRLDDPGHLVAQAHGFGSGPGQASHADVAQVAPADPAGGDAHHGVARPRFRFGDLVDSHVARSVHPYLQHGQPSLLLRGVLTTRPAW